MNLQDTINILRNRLASLQNLKLQHWTAGNMQEYFQVETEISETEAVVRKLEEV